MKLAAKDSSFCDCFTATHSTLPRWAVVRWWCSCSPGHLPATFPHLAGFYWQHTDICASDSPDHRTKFGAFVLLWNPANLVNIFFYYCFFKLHEFATFNRVWMNCMCTHSSCCVLIIEKNGHRWENIFLSKSYSANEIFLWSRYTSYKPCSSSKESTQRCRTNVLQWPVVNTFRRCLRNWSGDRFLIVCKYCPGQKQKYESYSKAPCKARLA